VTRDTGLPKNVHHSFRAEQQFDRPPDERCHRLLVAQKIFAHGAHRGVGSPVLDKRTTRVTPSSKQNLRDAGILASNSFLTI
jgi:hypothetical protein